MGVQNSDGEGEQRGRSNESAEWHHGQGGNAEKVVVMVVDQLKCKNHTGLNLRWRGTRYYEKPTRARQRVNYEKCTAIYNEDMSNKVSRRNISNIHHSLNLYYFRFAS